MGEYINPTGGRTKEQWLYTYGQPLTLAEALEQPRQTSDGTLVCWVQNSAFSAAGIAVDETDRQTFLSGFLTGSDTRPFQFYRVPTELLRQFVAGGKL